MHPEDWPLDPFRMFEKGCINCRMQKSFVYLSSSNSDLRYDLTLKLSLRIKSNFKED